MDRWWLSLVGVLLLAAVHVASGRLHGGGEGPRPRWLSAAGGVSVAYVFVHLLPELAEAQARWLEAMPERPLRWLDRQVYLTALAGLIVALAVDRAGRRPGRLGFRLHLASFALYNLLIGGFALRVHAVLPLALGVLAFGAHLLVNDHGLNERYGRLYERRGRWLLAAMLPAGWLVAELWRPPVIAGATVLGLISGGIILIVIREELPEAREARFLVFASATAAYAALLLALARSLRAG